MPARHRRARLIAEPAAALADPDPLVRVAAATSLKAFPAVAGNLTDRLLDLMSHDADRRVRAGAAIALGYLEAPGEKVLQALENAAQSGEPNLAKAARAALAILNRK